ncbi:hypothetical protein D9V34_00830 [Mycetocola lacteus]|uniref:Uncharacterized protein n=1 Tax=Mycetocola lacteus TaxID=76637 RepID=A0A3L7AM29_9MICO|nr:hypothetical protein [Mycetocola lacteus]RLP80790.1 hypothetical protein D9V34_13125 [Mycetocola lacteus]RLP84575.1 hypothetical protein D9V34_00830 [Mycetocola lacteus]
MVDTVALITPDTVRDHRALQRGWRQARLTLIGTVAGTVIILLGLAVPQIAGRDSVTGLAVSMSALVILLGSIVVAHAANTIRRLSNTHRRLVLVAAILLGCSAGAPVLTLSTIEAVAHTLLPPAGQSENPETGWPTILVGAGTLVVWALVAVVLCQPERESTARRYLVWRILTPVMVVIGVGVPAGIILTADESTYFLGDFAVFQLLILMVGAGWAGIAGYVFSLYLVVGLRASARVFAHRDAPDIRHHSRAGAQRAAYALSMAALLMAGIAWLLSHDRIATFGLGLTAPKTLSPDQVPSLAITAFAGAALVCAVVAWWIRRTRSTWTLLIATAVIVLCTLAAAWGHIGAPESAPHDAVDTAATWVAVEG